MKDLPKTPKRLYFENGEWNLEVEGFTLHSRGVFRPEISVISGGEEIVNHLMHVMGYPDLATQAQVTMSSLPSGNEILARWFEPRGNQWILAPFKSQSNGVTRINYPKGSIMWHISAVDEEVGKLKNALTEIEATVLSVNAKLDALELRMNEVEETVIAVTSGQIAINAPSSNAPAAASPESMSLPADSAAGVVDDTPLVSPEEALALTGGSDFAAPMTDAPPANPAPVSLDVLEGEEEWMLVIKAVIEGVQDVIGAPVQPAVEGQHSVEGETPILAYVPILGRWSGAVAVIISKSFAEIVAATFCEVEVGELSEIRINEALSSVAKLVGEKTLKVVPGPSYVGSPVVGEGDSATVEHLTSQCVGKHCFVFQNACFEVIVLPES